METVTSVAYICVAYCILINMTEQANNVKFVQEVEKYPCLYNYELSQYSRKDIKDSAWDNVGNEMNMSGMFLSK